VTSIFEQKHKNFCCQFRQKAVK